MLFVLVLALLAVARAESACKDHDEQCPRLAAKFCGDDEIKEACPLSCGNCASAESALQESACKDHDRQCPSLAEEHYCDQDSIKEMCPLSCGKCGSGCVDSLPELCRGFAASGQCNVNKALTESCPKSCGNCDLKKRASAESDCKDEEENCPSYAQFCGENSVKEVCPLTCGVCGCADRYADCKKTFVTQGYCKLYEKTAFYYCQKACDLCHVDKTE